MQEYIISCKKIVMSEKSTISLADLIKSYNTQSKTPNMSERRKDKICKELFMSHIGYLTSREKNPPEVSFEEYTNA